MITDIEIKIIRGRVRNSRYVYCEAHAENEHTIVETLEVPRNMPNDVALHYGRQLFENTLRKKGYEIAENEQ